MGWSTSKRFRGNRFQILRALVYGEENLLVGVGRIDEKSKPSCGLFDGRIENRLHVHTGIDHLAGQLQGMQRVSCDHRNNGCLTAVACIQASFFGFGQEQSGCFFESCDTTWVVFESADSSECGGRVGWREPDAEHEAWGGEFEVFDQGVFASDIASARAEGFAQCSHPYIDIVGVDTEMLGESSAAGAHRTDRVRFVDHQPALMFLANLHELGEIREVAVHAVDTFDDDQHTAVPLALFGEGCIEGFVIIVWERSASASGKNGSLDDAVVGQGIVKDQVLLADDVSDDRFVGGVTTHHDDRVFHPDPVRDFLFELTVDILLATDQSGGGYAGAVLLGRLEHRLGDIWVAAHTEVVVAGETDQVLAVDSGCVPSQALMD